MGVLGIATKCKPRHALPRNDRNTTIELPAQPHFSRQNARRLNALKRAIPHSPPRRRRVVSRCAAAASIFAQFSPLRRLARGLDPVRCSRQRASGGVIDDPARHETVDLNLCEHPHARVAWSVGGRLYEEEPGCLSQNCAAGLGAAGVELELDHTALAEE